MSSLAARFSSEVLGKLRARAEAQGIGVIRLVRTRVLERLDASRSPRCHPTSATPSMY
jgi:hypothetical protein